MFICKESPTDWLNWADWTSNKRTSQNGWMMTALVELKDYALQKNLTEVNHYHNLFQSKAYSIYIYNKSNHNKCNKSQL